MPHDRSPALAIPGILKLEPVVTILVLPMLVSVKRAVDLVTSPAVRKPCPTTGTREFKLPSYHARSTPDPFTKARDTRETSDQLQPERFTED
jgi:hypothetical protein